MLNSVKLEDLINMDLKNFSNNEINYWDKNRLIKNSNENKLFMEQIVKVAEFNLEKNIDILPFSLFRLYDESGSRKEYEKAYFNRRKILNCYVIAYLIFEKEKYLRKIEDYLFSICNEFTWCLPAHIDIKDINSDYIDLFSAETGFSLAEILNLLGDKIHNLIRKRVVNEVKRKILDIFKYKNFWWEESKMNWSSVCASSIGASAIYLLDGLEFEIIIKKVFYSIENYMLGFSDGICKEGINYWNYGFGFFVYFADLLKKRTKVDLFSNSKVRNIAKFQQLVNLENGYLVNFSDSENNFKFNQGLTKYLNSIYPEIVIYEDIYKINLEDTNCYRWQTIFRNLIWDDIKDIKNKQNKSLNESNIFIDSQWIVSKINKNKKIFFAAKGGNNEEPHNHNDLGHFIIKVDNKMLMTDLGTGLYNKNYFGDNRYDNICTGSQGHSVPIINKVVQKSGINSYTILKEHYSLSEKDYFSVDFKNVYSKTLKYYNRAFEIYKNNKAYLTVKDEFIFDKKPFELVERFISSIYPYVDEKENCVLFSDLDTKLKLDAENTVKIKEKDYINNENKKVRFYIIDFYILNLKKEISIEAQFKF
jgi:hypothetical protein